MISADVFDAQPTLSGSHVRLEPLATEHFDGIWSLVTDPEVMRLTGTRHRFSEDEVRRLLATRKDQHDRADWAIVSAEDDAVLGEAVLNELDEHNASMNYRIALAGSQLFGRGYGTEATKLVVDYGFDVAGLHRIELDVYDFNPRAQRVYEKCGFVREGVHRDALRWDGQCYDAISMAILATDSRLAS